MRVKNEELRTTREVARELLSILDLLEDLHGPTKIVISHNGRMRAVIISVDHYETLTEVDE